MCGTANLTAMVLSLQRIALMCAVATASVAWRALSERISGAENLKPEKEFSLT